jgi:hypothetical protein
MKDRLPKCKRTGENDSYKRDDTPPHLFLVGDEVRMPIGRPHLTFYIDAFSGYPFGFRINDDSPGLSG